MTARDKLAINIMFDQLIFLFMNRTSKNSLKNISGGVDITS